MFNICSSYRLCVQCIIHEIICFVCVCHTKNVNTVACTNKYTHICLCVPGSPHCTSFDSTALFTCNYCRCNWKILSHLSCLCEGLDRYSTYPLSLQRLTSPSLSMQLAFKNSYFQAHILYLSFFISLSLSLYRVSSLFTNKWLYTNLQGICTFRPLTLLNQSGVVYVSKRRDCKKEREFVCVCVLPHCERRDKVHGCTFY